MLRDGKPIALGQRAYALLEALARTDGAVGKAALMEAAWPGTIVEEGNLTVQIAALRKALGTRADGQEWIVTVPRVGYRLLRESASTPRRASRSLPVLPCCRFKISAVTSSRTISQTEWSKTSVPRCPGFARSR